MPTFLDNFDQPTLDPRWTVADATLDTINDRVDLSTGNLGTSSTFVNNSDWDSLDITVYTEHPNQYTSGSIYLYITDDASTLGVGCRLRITRMSTGGTDIVGLSFSETSGTNFSSDVVTDSTSDFTPAPPIRIQRNASGQWTVSVDGVQKITSYAEPAAITAAVSNAGLLFEAGSAGTGYVLSVQQQGDETAPILSGGTVVQGSTTAEGRITTNEATGTIYGYVSQNAVETEGTVIASGDSQVVNVVGEYIFNETGLLGEVTYYYHFAHTDVSSNTSSVTSVQFTTDPYSREVVNINTTNQFEAGSQVEVTTTGLDSNPTTQIVTFEGVIFNVVSWVDNAGVQTITVDAPLHSPLGWPTTGTLSVTDDTGVVTLVGATQVAPSDWSTVVFNGEIPDTVGTESFYEETITDLSYTMVAGDILAWEDSPNFTVDASTYPTIVPPATVTGGYKVWRDATQDWTVDSTYTWTDGGATVVLSNPIGVATSGTTANANVDTTIGSGTLYYYISQNSTESANLIKTDGQIQAVTQAGTQDVSFTGLTEFTNYYVHFVQISAELDESSVVSTPRFTTADTTAPVISSPTAIETGETTAFATVSTDEGNGTLYTYTSVNATELLATIKASGQTQPVSATGTQNITITGLTEGTSYYVHFVHADSTGNDSNIVTSAQFTTQEQGDTTPPVLTNPTATATGATTADTSVTTDEGNGIAYIYVSTNPTENLTTLKASGQQEVVTAAGLITSSIAGLTASTEYYAHFLHEDASGNPSVIVTSTAFTTSAAGVDEPTITNIDGDNDVYPGQVAVITGTNFGTSVGTVTLDGIDQTVTHWADTQIIITVVKGTMEYGGGKQLVVTLP